MWYVRGGVHGGVSRRAFWDTGSVVDDVFVAVTALALALVVEVLAEFKGHAAPSLEGVVAQRAALHAGVAEQEVATSHAFGRVPWHGAAAQTLVVTALLMGGTSTVDAFGRANCEGKRVRKELVRFIFFNAANYR